MAKVVWADPMLQWSHFSHSIWRRGEGFETTQIVHRHLTANRSVESADLSSSGMASIALKHQKIALLLSTEASYIVHRRKYLCRSVASRIITLSTNCTHHEARSQ